MRATSPARAVAPAHTDWLYHRLRVSGPPDTLAAFREQAAGAGTVPWRLDLEQIEEDIFLRLASPPAPQRRSLSLEGGRMLAAELREAVATRHALATARVGRSRACGFDLHELLPVPEAILALGPDHPDAIDWLWTNWGTTQALRHVTVEPTPRGADAPGEAVFELSFWSADWTPWRAFTALQARWTALRFVVTPRYDRA